MDIEHARLAWRCRRGMKELDLLLLGWLQRHYDEASLPDRAAFAALLELPDPQLVAYLLGRERPDDALQARVLQSIVTPPTERARQPAGL